MHDPCEDTPNPPPAQSGPPEKLAWVPPRLEALDTAIHTQGGAITGPPEDATSYS